MSFFAGTVASCSTKGCSRISARPAGRRWRMPPGTLGSDEPASSQGTTFDFRQRRIARDLDRRLLERTVGAASATGRYARRSIRRRRSGRGGAGRGEDTFNPIGHAVRDVLRAVARRRDVPLAEAAKRAGAPPLSGRGDARPRPGRPGAEGERPENAALAVEPPLSEQRATVAKERRISVRDRALGRGRKGKSSRSDGHERHLAVDLPNQVIPAAAIAPASRPEGEASGDLLDDVERQRFAVEHLRHDRACLLDPAVEARRFRDMQVRAKASPCTTGDAAPGRTSSSTSGRGRSPVRWASRCRSCSPPSEARCADGLAARHARVREKLFDVRRHAAVAHLRVAAA